MKSNSYYKLQKALHGLLQAPLQWVKKLSEDLKGIKFNQLETDFVVFTKMDTVNNVKHTVSVLAYVDYLIFLSGCELILLDNIKTLFEVISGSE